MFTHTVVDLIALFHPQNPKEHDLGAIRASIEQFGYLEPVVLNDVTNHILSGHGRLEALYQMQIERHAPPTGIHVSESGEWFMDDSLVHHVEVPEKKEPAAIIALNRITEIGGWNEPRLAELLAQIAREDDEALLFATGYTPEDLESLLFDLDPLRTENLVTGGKGIESPGFHIVAYAPSMEVRDEIIAVLTESGYTEIKVERGDPIE